MGDYRRSTRECTRASLNPVLAAAIQAHLEQNALGDLYASALVCCETTSTRWKKGLFGGKQEVILTGVILTSRWLVWASGMAGEAPGVLSARVGEFQVQDYETSALNRLAPDTGVTLNGLRTDLVAPGSAFIGLGPEPAGQKLRFMLKAATARAA